ncbi:AAA family ATPase [Streptomyces sp. NPDC050804]|uniref:AAA family ATPase n=1 Tax=Streptomyces sp. NPDC050804 TaxID=3154745 RepID=UPI00341DA95E
MEASFQRRELVDLLHRLDTPDCRGVFVLGGPGIGKTVLLRQLEAELQRQGRAAFLVSLRGIDVDDLSARIVSEITRLAGAFEVERTIRASGSDSLRQSSAVLNLVAERLQAPVLLLDALDESRYPQRTAAAIEELSHTLCGWRIVVASRPACIEVRRFVHFGMLQLGPLAEAEMLAMLRESAPNLAEDVVGAVVRQANGSPFFARLMARYVQNHAAPRR